MPRSHLRFETQLGCDSRAIRWRTCVCSRWYIHITRWQRWFDSGSFFFRFIYITQKSSEHNRKCSRIVEVDLVYFMWSKNPPSATEDARRCDSPIISNAVRTSNHNRIAKQWRHHHESLSNHGRVAFRITSVNWANLHVVKDWKISFITSERTIPLPKNKNRISYAKTTLLWPVFLSMANQVLIFGHIGCVISPDRIFICFVLKLA